MLNRSQTVETASRFAQASFKHCYLNHLRLHSEAYMDKFRTSRADVGNLGKPLLPVKSSCYMHNSLSMYRVGDKNLIGLSTHFGSHFLVIWSL